MKKFSIFTLIIPIALSGALYGAEAAADREFKLQQEAKAKSAEENFKAGLLALSEDEKPITKTPSESDDKQLAADIALAQDLCQRGCGLPIAQYLTEGWQLERTLGDHTNHVFLRICEINDKEYLVSASRDGKIRIWDPVDGSLKFHVQLDTMWVQDFDAASSGNTIYFALAETSRPKTPILGKIIQLSQVQLYRPMSMPHVTPIAEVVISMANNDSGLFVVETRSLPNKESYLWNFETGELNEDTPP